MYLKHICYLFFELLLLFLLPDLKVAFSLRITNMTYFWFVQFLRFLSDIVFVESILKLHVGFFYVWSWYGIFRNQIGWDFSSSTVGWTRTGGNKTNFHFTHNYTKGHWFFVFLVQYDLKSTVWTLFTFDKIQLDDFFFILKIIAVISLNSQGH